MEASSAGLLSPEKLTAYAVTNPFGLEHDKYVFDIGMTISEILTLVYPNVLKYRPRVYLNDHFINPEFYHVIRPKAGSVISIRLDPMGGGGGKNPLKTILSVALLATGAFAASVFAPALASSLGVGQAFAGSLIRGAVGIVGNLLINALVPPAQPKRPIRSPSAGGKDVSQTYFIQGARNRLTPNGPLPEVLGTHKIVPPLAAQNYTEVSGDKIFSRQVFALSLGSISVSSEKIGQTLLTQFTGVTEENKFSGNSLGSLSIYPGIVSQLGLNIQYNAGPTAFSTRTTASDVDEFEVELTFPNGLGQISTQGDRLPLAIQYEIRYAPTGTSSFTSQTFTETRNTSAAFSIGHRFNVSNGQYDVGVRRVSPLDTGEDRNFNDYSWTALRSYQHENPIKRDGLSIKALRIQGSEQLNGAVDQYNCIATRTDILDWNGSSWVAGATSNPASLYRYILQSEFSKEQIEDSEIILTDLQDWHDFCAEKELTYDAYIDYEADREQLLQEIAAAGLATPTIVDNKYTVVVDKAKNDIIQAISPRNSRDYKYEKVFLDQPHAIRIPFLNKDKDYLEDEIIVYDDGYDSTNATEFIQLDFPGVTNTNALYKLARHRLAEVRLRPDMHSVVMDVENLVATKGDRVKFQHDVALIGLGSGRVKSVTDNGVNITAVVMDEDFTIESGKSYTIRFRLSNNTYITRSISNSAGTTDTLTFTTPEAIANGPAVGDIGFFGETGSETIDGLIHSIRPLNDLEAEIRIVEYGAGIFTASDGTIPSYNNNITIPPEFSKPSAPILVNIQTDEIVQVRNMDGSISNRMVITLKNTNLYPVEAIVLFRSTDEDEFREPTTLAKTANKIIIDDLQIGSSYDIRIRYRRLGGAELGPDSVSDALNINGQEFLGTSTLPPDVQNFDITVRGESVRLTWDRINVIDLDRYELRFSPVTSGADWASGIPLDENIPPNTTSTTVPSAIGTYMIKAIDSTNNYSENETLAVTTVGKLLALNVVETITEAPTWGGTFNGTTNDSGNLKLGGTSQIDDWTDIDSISFWDFGEGSIASGGTYDFANTIDLGAVYDNVLSASLTVSGESVFDEIDEWTDIDSRDNWDGTSPDQYSVMLQVRTTNDDPNATPVWSSYAPLRPLGEYTARAFQFRLVLTANVADITPVVSAANIIIDMPDRLESDDDIASGTGGKVNTFAESFRVTPTIEITADNMATGDYYTITSKSASGFTIEFFDSTNTSVDRTFSYIAKGYGRTT